MLCVLFYTMIQNMIYEKKKCAVFFYSLDRVDGR